MSDGVFTLYELAGAAVLAADDVSGDTQAAQLAEKINQFSYQLLALVDDGKENFVFSPFSVYMALACLSNGAVDSAYEQLRDVLYPQGMDKDAFNKACAELAALLTYREEKTDGATSDDPKYALENQPCLR
jgi:serine protease inhibitor